MMFPVVQRECNLMELSSTTKHGTPVKSYKMAHQTCRSGMRANGVVKGGIYESLGFPGSFGSKSRYRTQFMTKVPEREALVSPKL